MSDFDRNAASSAWGRPVTRAEAAVVDQGLRAYMLRIYNYMALGLAITGFAALGVYMLAVTGDAASAGRVIQRGLEIPAQVRPGVFLTSIGVLLYQSPLKWVVILAPLAMVFFFTFRLERMRVSTAHATFWLFAALIGVSLSSLALVYTHASIAKVFFITAASFGAVSLYGYTTQRELSGMGSFLIMGLFGLIIASLVNFWLKSDMMQFIISIIGVLVFAGLTAWDTQRLKSEYIYGSLQGDIAEKSAISGALSLYLNFINMFTFLLQLFGQREQ
jgi:uncharacterized protein